jgi:hypothetical protein
VIESMGLRRGLHIYQDRPMIQTRPTRDIPDLGEGFPRDLDGFTMGVVLKRCENHFEGAHLGCVMHAVPSPLQVHRTSTALGANVPLCGAGGTGLRRYRDRRSAGIGASFRFPNGDPNAPKSSDTIRYA